MRGIHSRWTFFRVLLMTGIAAHAAARAAEPTPDEVLKNNGLTKSGLLYVLDSERGFLDGTTKIQPRYADMEKLYARLNLIMQGQLEYDGLDNAYTLSTERLRNVGAEIDAFPTTSNSELKQHYRELLDLEKQIRFQRNELSRELDLRYKNLVPEWQREKLFTDFQAKRQGFLTESRSLRARGDEVKARYQKLSKDDGVTKAIAALRLTSKARVDLGPSAEFKKKSTLLKDAERTFSPESFKRRKASKKSGQKTRADATTGKSRGPAH
jgi:hypothetical protein